MDLLQLKYFHTVALYGNITRAAKALHISQPSLSIMISRLEKELGVPLFDRKGRGIVLNAYGNIMLGHATTILKEVDKAIYEVSMLRDNQAKEMNFCSNSKGLTALLLKDFIRKTNFFNIRQRGCGIVEAEELVLHGDYHFAITSPPLKNDELTTVSLFKGTVVCVMSKVHPLAHNSVLTTDQIKDENFFSLYTSETSRSQRRDLFEEYFGFMPNIVFEGEKEVILDLVAENQGILLTIQYPSLEEFGDEFSAVPIAGLEQDWEVGLSWKKGNENIAPYQYFLQYINNQFLNKSTSEK